MLAAACGTVAHQRALAIAKAYAGAHGYTGRVTCSNGIGGIHPRTPDFICDLQVHQTICDEIEVRRSSGHWHVTFRRRGVECVLPV